MSTFEMKALCIDFNIRDKNTSNIVILFNVMSLIIVVGVTFFLENEHD